MSAKLGDDRMNWFQKHINWTYIFILLLATLALYSTFFITSLGAPADDELYGLRIYLDSSYSQEWGDFNGPDLNNLSWGPDNKNGDAWETATLVAYLENTGPYILDVDVSSTSDSKFAIAGWSVSSDTVTLGPGERTPIAIRASHNIWLDVNNPMFYFNVVPEYTEANWEWMLYIGYAIVFVIAAGWVLHQKGRSYGWLLLSLSGIGVIILLCLENRRVSSEVDLVLPSK